MDIGQPAGYGNARRWRWWVLPSVMRAAVGVGFTATPSVSERVGEAALPTVCVVLAIAVWVGLGLDWYARRALDRIELATDGLTVLVVIPLIALTGGIQVADGRFGGRLENVVAAFVATIAILLGLVLVARVAPVRWPGAPAIAILPAALSAAVIFAGPELFTTSRFWQGISLAWMLAAVLTLLAGLVAPRNRPILALIGYAGLAVAVLIWSSTASGPNINAAANTISIITVVLIGLILLMSSSETGRQPATRRTRSAPDH